MGLTINTGLGAVMDLGTKLVDRLIPDKAAADAAKLELLRMQQAGEFKAIDDDFARDKMQVEVNAIEAASPNPFASSWRPAVGWVCVGALTVNYFVVPMLAWASPVLDVPAPQMLDLSELWPLLLGMLGIGTMRSVEKVKGVAR